MRIPGLGVIIVALPIIAGCAVAGPMRVESQCLREAWNSPDAVRRKAEYQQPAQTRPVPRSQRPQT